jgi:hypothetical protein
MFPTTTQFLLSFETSLESSASSFDGENGLLTFTYLGEILLMTLSGLITAI